MTTVFAGRRKIYYFAGMGLVISITHGGLAAGWAYSRSPLIAGFCSFAMLGTLSGTCVWGMFAPGAFWRRLLRVTLVTLAGLSGIAAVSTPKSFAYYTALPLGMLAMLTPLCLYHLVGWRLQESEPHSRSEQEEAQKSGLGHHETATQQGQEFAVVHGHRHFSQPNHESRTGRYSIADLLALTTLTALAVAGAVQFPAREDLPLLLLAMLILSSIFVLPSSLMTLHAQDVWDGLNKSGCYLMTWAMTLSIPPAIAFGLSTVPEILAGFLGFFIGLTAICLMIRATGRRLVRAAGPRG